MPLLTTPPQIILVFPATAVAASALSLTGTVPESSTIGTAAKGTIAPDATGISAAFAADAIVLCAVMNPIITGTAIGTVSAAEQTAVFSEPPESI